MDKFIQAAQKTGLSIQDATEIATNHYKLLGAYTNKELTAHKNAEIQSMVQNPGKIYVIHTKADSMMSNTIRLNTYRFGDVDNVNHSALAFQNPSDGKVYVIDITAGGSKDTGLPNTDVRLKTLENWIAGDEDVVDIQAQAVPISERQLNGLRETLSNVYVNFQDKKPKINLQYDYEGALAEGINTSISHIDNKKICSELVSDILRDGAGIEIKSLDNDNYISPNELRHQLDDLIKRVPR